MLTTRPNQKLISYLLILAGLGLFALLRGNSASLAQGNGGYIEEVRSLETNDAGLLNPAGLAYSFETNLFFMLEAEITTQATIVTMTPYEDRLAALNVNVSALDPVNIAFDDQGQRLLLLDSGADEVIAIKTGPDGYLEPDPEAERRFQVGLLGLQQPRGMTVDPTSGALYILDSAALEIVRIEPDDEGSFEAGAALSEGRVSEIGLEGANWIVPRGLALDRSNGHLYLLGGADEQIYELSEQGEIIGQLDISQFGLVEPQGLVFAWSGDLTDDPANINLYLADTGRSGQTSDSLIEQQEIGRVIELSLRPPTQIALLSDAPQVRATLERTTKTYKYSPPSTDSSGLAYLSNSNRLLISDSEVNENSYFTGDNLFKIKLSGKLVETLTTLSFTDEPTGVAYNPFNDHLYFSDDTGKRWVFEMDPGSDGRYDTSDDIITKFKTRRFGSYDPEGIAFDSWQGHLFVVDGENEEVYEIDPGSNGIFEGKSGDDKITHFDTTGLGLKDPEGVEFNPDNGHLYILSGRSKIITETTTDGNLIRTIDISSVPQIAAAGLAYAPASANSTQMNLYIVDRGSDSSRKKDGKLFEISFPPNIDAIKKLRASNDGPNLLGSATTLTATIKTGDDVHYEWDFGDGSSPDSSGSIVTHIYAEVGTYIATVKASNSVNTRQATTLVTIQDIPPSAAFSSSGLNERGQVINFTNESTGSNLTFAWDFGDGSATGLDTHPTHIYSSAGVFTIMLTATNSIGSDSVSAQIVIEDDPLIDDGDSDKHWFMYLPLITK